MRGRESQGEREPHLGERGGSEPEHGEERVDSTVKKGRFQRGEGGKVRRASLRELDCTNQQPPQRGGAVPGPVWVGSKWLLVFPRVPVTPDTPLYLFAMLPPERPQQAAHSIYKIGRLFSLFLFSCPSLALLRLLILLLLLMSGNVHPNPGPIFPCSVCAGNVT